MISLTHKEIYTIDKILNSLSPYRLRKYINHISEDRHFLYNKNENNIFTESLSRFAKHRYAKISLHVDDPKSIACARLLFKNMKHDYYSDILNLGLNDDNKFSVSMSNNDITYCLYTNNTYDAYFRLYFAEYVRHHIYGKRSRLRYKSPYVELIYADKGTIQSKII